jgi:hypothetical protein
MHCSTECSADVVSAADVLNKHSTRSWSAWLERSTKGRGSNRRPATLSGRCHLFTKYQRRILILCPRTLLQEHLLPRVLVVPSECPRVRRIGNAFSRPGASQLYEKSTSRTKQVTTSLPGCSRRARTTCIDRNGKPAVPA